MTVTIDVTQEDIDAGCRGNAFGCPIARATRRALGSSDKNSITVEPSRITFYNKDGVRWKDYDLPEPARLFVIAFDNNHPVEPFSFEVDA